MFNKENDYLNAIKHAQVYTRNETKSSNKKLLIFNLIFLAILGYVTFTYLQNTKNTLSLPVSKQAVLGVSEIVDDFELSDDRLMEILKGTEAQRLQDSMKVLMREPSIQSKSSYTDAIARELDDKSGFRGRIAVVKYGDTLSSLSEKYYGNSNMFTKIIDGNQNLINKESMLRVGQTIKIPN